MVDPIQFHLPAAFDIGQFMKGSFDPHTIEKEPSTMEAIRIYDTFDWRLFHKSLVLYGCEGKLCLRRLTKREVIHSVDITSFPGFIWEFPAGGLKDHLAEVIGPRALLQLAEIKSRSTPYRLLDRERKTVVRLVCEEIRSPHGKSAPASAARLWLLPVKGYSRHSQRIARSLQKAGLALRAEDDVYFKAMEAAGKKPGSYSSKLNLRLDPDMRAAEATRVVLRFLLRIMRINAAYIGKDIDTEFIHDFRVAVRRTRAALGQIPSVFPARITERFKRDFAFVGKLTNELRDLDVCLLKEDAYKGKIAPVLRNDIEPLFGYLRKKRSEAFQKVVRGLKSKRYGKIVKDWETFLESSPKDYPGPENADVFIIDLARGRIYKKYRSVVKTGMEILEGTDDRMLHVLRIHCKKLRYLMEFFASLFPPDAIGTSIEQLKRLQDNLGDFNDLRVQEEYLLSVAKRLAAARGRSERVFLAIGSLVGALARDREVLRGAFAETFADFASPANMELFKDLFAAQTPGGNP